MVAMTPKPVEFCTPAEQRSISEYKEFQSLRNELAAGLTTDQKVRYDQLNDKSKKGELHSFFSYTNEIWFYLIYAFVVGLYYHDGRLSCGGHYRCHSGHPDPDILDDPHTCRSG